MRAAAPLRLRRPSVMFSLTDLCLNRITEDPARCLRRGDETQPALLRPANDAFIRCDVQTVHRDRWAAVESSTIEARRRPRPTFSGPTGVTEHLVFYTVSRVNPSRSTSTVDEAVARTCAGDSYGTQTAVSAISRGREGRRRRPQHRRCRCCGMLFNLS